LATVVRDRDSTRRITLRSRCDGKKVLVLGSSGHAGITCAPWDATPLPNIVDFDLCLVNVRSLTNEVLVKANYDHFDAISAQLRRLLKSDGTVIALMDALTFASTPDQISKRTSNYDWCPFNLRFWAESGDSIVIDDDVVPTYLSKLKCWDFYYECVSPNTGWAAFVGRDDIAASDSRSIVRNREGRMLGGAHRVEFYKVRRKSEL